MTDLTIVVPTRDRPRELGRLLAVCAAAREVVPVLVLDGSAQRSNVDENRRRCAEHDLVRHLEFDPDLHLGLRLAEGLTQVTTRYVAFCGDDDVIFVETALKGTEFLADRADFSAVMGRFWTLRYFANRRLLGRGIVLGDELFNALQFDQPLFIQRALFYYACTASGAAPLFYSVRRTEQARQVFSHIQAELRYSSMEVLVTSLTLMQGKVAVLADGFGMRDYSSVTTRDAIREGDRKYIPDEDMPYLRAVLESQLAQSPVADLAAPWAVEALLSLWDNGGSASAEGVVSPQAHRLRRVSRLLQSVAVQLAPGALAAIHGMPVEFLQRVLRAHQRS